MTLRQNLLKLFYPVFNSITQAMGKHNKTYQSTTMAPVSFYDLTVTLNDGKIFHFSDLRNKKVLLVNTASDCGYTHQYESLQALYDHYKGSLHIIGFPSNDFGEQEKGDDTAIEQFCKINYGISFPISKKTCIIKKEGQHEVYQWLSNKNKNGWNEVAPPWNFCKYLINENGNLTHFFEPGVEPMGIEIKEAIENNSPRFTLS
jgi:glutathione peroxidase